MPKLGYLEWYVILQALMMAMLFVPGISPVRPLLRVASYGIGLVFWVLIAWQGRPAGPNSLPAKPWLLFCIGWLVLQIGHPNSYSIPAAVCQVILYVAIMSPAFWISSVLQTPRQLTRLLAILFVINALSSVLGLAQVFKPERFLPPEIPAMSNIFGGEDLKLETVDGRRILRPCGLSDSPGGAAPSGVTAAMLGLCFALRPIGAIRRVACAGMAFCGVAVIYYTQIRSSLVMLVLSFVVIIILFLCRGNVRNAMTLMIGAAGMVVGALLWVVRTMGNSTLDRFKTLVGSDTGNMVMQSRGKFVQETLGRFAWEFPLGYGLGWWGMIHGMFRNPSRISPVWVEVMISAWIYDGGVPLMIGYSGAIVVALFDSLRIALKSRDPDIQFWAAAVVAQNLSLAMNCFSFVTFLSPAGISFWMFAAALHAADARSREGDGSRQGRAPRPPKPGRLPRPQGVTS